MGVAFADFDGSGPPGLAIANDEMAGDLFRPHRSGATVKYARLATSGTAYDRDGNVHGGMGIDWGDYDNDGKLDLFVATFQHETKWLYHNDGGDLFGSRHPDRLSSVTTPNVAFGCKLFDYDNDGWLDLIIANGHVQDNIHRINSTADYRESLQLLHNSGGDPILFQDVSGLCGIDFRPSHQDGLAIGDYDNDGKLDALVVNSEGCPLLLHNQTRPAGHWLTVKLRGTRSNRDGYGCMLTAKVGSRTLLRFCHADGSYMSSSDSRVHFGLGPATRIYSLSLRWPSGLVETYHNVPADQVLRLREGEGPH